MRLALFALALCLPFSAQAQNLEKAIFAGGCFWCTEKDFEALPGVVEVISGFSGGAAEDAEYASVSKGRTKHVEAVEVTFDADLVSYRQLVDYFWRTVDVLDDGGQFCDRGHSYTTAVFPLSADQMQAAQASKTQAEAALGQAFVTPVVQGGPFFPADAYHQDFYKTTDTKIWTRYGRLTKAEAYKKYRKSCGRDQRVRALWGAAAYGFAGS